MSMEAKQVTDNGEGPRLLDAKAVATIVGLTRRGAA